MAQLARVATAAQNAGAVTTYRTITAQDGTTPPNPATAALWALNPSAADYTTCRFYITQTGTFTALKLRAYVRCGGTAGTVGGGTLTDLFTNYPTQAYLDVPCQGDDVALLAETFTGGTNIVVTCRFF